MGELSNALRMLSNLSLTLIQNPNGTWSYVGTVPAHLRYVAKDGSPATDEQIAKAVKFGPRLAGVGTRVWATKEAAEQAAKESN